MCSRVKWEQVPISGLHHCCLLKPCTRPLVVGAQVRCGFLHSAKDAEPGLSIPCSGHTAQMLLAPSKPAHSVGHCSLERTQWPPGTECERCDVYAVWGMEPVHCFLLQSINLPWEPSGHRRQLIPLSPELLYNP